MKRKWPLFKISFLGLMSIGTIVLMYGVSRLTHHRTTCIFDALGKPCWGCNSLAALKAIMRGQLLEAFTLNPLIFLWLLVVIGLLANEIYHRIDDRITHQTSLSWMDKLIRGMFKGINY